MSLIYYLLLGLMATVTVALAFLLVKVMKNDQGLALAFGEEESTERTSNVQEKSELSSAPAIKPRKEEEAPPNAE